MATLRSIVINNYRSIKGPLRLDLQRDCPLVLLGENNVGKSNIVRAFEFILGGFWPGFYQPEEHEFFDRAFDTTIRLDFHFDPEDPLGRGYERASWIHNPLLPEKDRTSFQGIYPTGRSGNISNDDRDTCYCVCVHAEDDLRYQLSYSSKYTLMSRIMHRFHDELKEQQEVRQTLENLFSLTKEQFYRIEAFASFITALREQLGDFLGSMSHRLDVDFEAYNPVNFFHALRLQPVEFGGVRALDELGTGEQQVLAISLAHAYANAFHTGVLLVLEEPESHLHPLAQKWLAQRLTSLAKGGLQLVMTTHSPHFVDVMNLEGMVLVRKMDGSTHTIQRSADDLVAYCIANAVPPHRVSRDNILPFYHSHATVDLIEGFFASTVVLVEGPTEALSLPVYLSKCGLEVTREGVAVMSVHGKGNLAKWYRLFTLFEIPTYIIFDNDHSDDVSGAHRREILSIIGIPEEEQTEHISEDAWIIDDRYCIFGQDFETILRAHFESYGVLEAEAKESRGISAKPFVARWIAERMEYDEAIMGWQCFRDLCESVQRLARVPSLKDVDTEESVEEFIDDSPED